MKLKDLRSQIGITQSELSKKIGIPTTTLFNYEAKKCDPSVATLIKLADFFNVTVDELLGREADTINLKFLSETESYLIKKILKMNQLELDKTKAYVMGLTE